MTAPVSAIPTPRRPSLEGTDLSASIRGLLKSLAALSVEHQSRPDVVGVCKKWALRLNELESEASMHADAKRA